MAITAEQAAQSLIAFQRFGLGAKPGGPERIGRNARAALKAEVNAAGIATIGNPNLPTYAKAAFEAESGFARAEAVRRREMDARIDKHRGVTIGFVERLVLFWSNHFSMTVNKSETVRGTIGQWERDVIRKNVLGRFSAMLAGTMRHPAMLSYLDNVDSIGPNSPIGQAWGVGFNENLAREALELHTLGSGGGYTEADVTQFALILTGWSYVRGWESDGGWNGGTRHNRGRFLFRANWHEPGPITFMGKTYAAEGQRQAEQVFVDLARHPATAEHIAFKLVRHFIADEPTPALVDPLKTVFLRSGGDLKQVALALIDLEAAWTTPLNKFRPPYEMTIAQFRALGIRYDSRDVWAFYETLRALHQMPWESPSPEGYSDDTLRWLEPDAMTIRLDTAQLSTWVYRERAGVEAAPLAAALFDKSMSSATRGRIAAAGNPTEALTILFTAPEFHRR